MTHRNRWFTELKNGDFFHGELLVITSTSLQSGSSEDWTRLKDAPNKVKGDRAAALAAVRQSPEADTSVYL